MIHKGLFTEKEIIKKLIISKQRKQTVPPSTVLSKATLFVWVGKRGAIC